MTARTLDEFDVRILHALQRDGRLGNQQLAEEVHLSPSQCSRRRTALEEAGVIRRYRAELDPERLGMTVTALVQVTLATHSPDTSTEFRALVGRIAAIQKAWSVTGDTDYVLQVIVADLRGLSTLISDVLLPHRSVAHVKSSIVLDTLKSDADIPLPDPGRG
ncbi:AsnC family transcriptional regulator [Azospirillum sp. SYSU D00513]|uniref:AsnC family transcriptional regulator n=1 Tax=Azospirillum sp. SYSU D00513 TaxID=2812561 RepID=UPI001A962429